MADSATASVTAGAASSSVIVSITAAGFATPLAPDTVAETVTALSGASTGLSFAVRVTTPVLTVEPAAMVSVVPVCVKSPETACVPATAATVSVTAALDARSSAAVTVATPPCSEIDDESASATVGVSSSSLNVSATPVTAPTPCSLAAVPVTLTDRAPTLSTASSTAVIVTPAEAFAVSPAAITISPFEPTV